MADKSNAKDKQDFFKNVKAEYRKIIWPTTKEIVKQSAAVVVATLVIALVIVGLDTIIQYGVDFLMGL